MFTWLPYSTWLGAWATVPLHVTTNPIDTPSKTGATIDASGLSIMENGRIIAAIKEANKIVCVFHVIEKQEEKR